MARQQRGSTRQERCNDRYKLLFGASGSLLTVGGELLGLQQTDVFPSDGKRCPWVSRVRHH
jgi:hypothetical protein